jgi:hypothetical protein
MLIACRIQRQKRKGLYTIAGVIRDIQNKVAKTGNPYAVVKIADDIR